MNTRTTQPVTPDLRARTGHRTAEASRGVTTSTRAVPLGDHGCYVGPCPECEPCPLALLGDHHTQSENPRGDADRTGAWTEADLCHWIALRRVIDGGVIQLDSHYWLDHGRTPPDYVIDALTRLFDAGLITLTGPDLGAALARAVLTNAGTTRYEQLTHAGRRMSGDQFIDLVHGR